MKRWKLSGDLVLGVLCAMVLMASAGCVEEAPPPGPVGYDYYYYPDEEVYFYPATGVYFWFGDGGWRSGRRLPHDFALREEGRVNLHLDTRRPYEQHERTRAQYPRHEGGARPEEGREHGPG